MKNQQSKAWRNGVPRSVNPSDEPGKYSWVTEDADKYIHRYYAENGGPLPYMLALYHVLTRIATEQWKSEFEVPRRELMVRSGISRTQLDKVLNILEEIGLIARKRNYLKTNCGLSDQLPNTYRLLSLTKR